MDDADRAQPLIERERADALARLRAAPDTPQQAIDGQAVCVDCAAAITAARLRAQPRAARCIGCQTDHERRLGPRQR